MRQETDKNKSRLIGLTVVLVAVDLFSKWGIGEKSNLVWNRGGLWGIFPGNWWLPMAATVWLGIFAIGMRKFHLDGGTLLGFALIMAGGLGNLIDRAVFGAVRDFIYYPYLEVYGNLADIFLGLGILILIWKQLKPKAYV